MSTVQEIERAIAQLSPGEWVELREWISAWERSGGPEALEERVGWSQSPSVTEARDPAQQIPAETVLNVLDEIRS